MGQKVHPYGFRLGVTKKWISNWYAEGKDYMTMLHEDLKLREYLIKELKQASVSEVMIERPANNIVVTIKTARPGIIIGRKGEDIEKLRNKVFQMFQIPVQINIDEIKRPELNSKLVADSVAMQLEKRVMFRRAMKRVVQNAMRSGATGIRIAVSGRLGGAEIARTECYREGRVPLHTLKANIDYAVSEALTTYGIIGIKVWIYVEDESILQKNSDAKKPMRRKPKVAQEEK